VGAVEEGPLGPVGRLALEAVVGGAQVAELFGQLRDLRLQALVLAGQLVLAGLGDLELLERVVVQLFELLVIGLLVAPSGGRPRPPGRQEGDGRAHTPSHIRRVLSRVPPHGEARRGRPAF